jgi:hypothetical protein
VSSPRRVCSAVHSATNQLKWNRSTLWLDGQSTSSGTAQTPVQPRQGELLGGKTWPPLVAGRVQHVNTPGVHVFGHLKHPIKPGVQGRFISRPGQRKVTRTYSNFVCAHNEYLYTSAPPVRKCANLTITSTQRGHRVIPIRTHPWLPGCQWYFEAQTKTCYLQQNRRRIDCA